MLGRYIVDQVLLVEATMEKRTYIVTGAGSGIGRAIAQELAEKQARCVLLGRTESSLRETLNLLPGVGHDLVLVDFSSKESIANAAKEVGELPIDGIIANAGVGGITVEDGKDRWDEIIGVNLTGTHRAIQAFLPHLRMSRSDYKQIVIVSSILARLGVPGYEAYCASKAGLLGLMRSLAVELAPEKILVNAICPGWVDTRMAAAGIEGMAAGMGVSAEEARQEAMRAVLLGKMSTAEEVAELVGYLLGQRSMTGQAIDINNGAIMPS